MVTTQMVLSIKNFKYFFARIIKKLRFSAVYNSEIDLTSAVESGSQVVDSSIARHSYCGYDCTVLNAKIGSFCSISDNVTIGGSNHPVHFVSTSPVFLSHRDSVKAKFSHHPFKCLPETIIEHDVWIGHGAKIKSGVTIGTGAVVGMGSIVTKDVAPYSIVAGNPARIIKMRFSDDQIAHLLQSKWWERSDDQLIALGKVCTNIEQFLEMENKL